MSQTPGFGGCSAILRPAVSILFVHSRVVPGHAAAIAEASLLQG